ncbi:hypothetical protein JOL62DRAFT_215558 [Phyllosticta paracitricarpa]|uniref:Uncharacterized protein n=1 Tax=Phyllosticta paracitricarpa TaxID=2016321 RepID=A0ABR1N081_9PEZI
MVICGDGQDDVEMILAASGHINGDFWFYFFIFCFLFSPDYYLVELPGLQQGRGVALSHRRSRRRVGRTVCRDEHLPSSNSPRILPQPAKRLRTVRRRRRPSQATNPLALHVAPDIAADKGTHPRTDVSLPNFMQKMLQQFRDHRPCLPRYTRRFITRLSIAFRPKNHGPSNSARL